MPGGAIGLAGSRHSTLRDKIVPLPLFVQQAMNLSFGRTPIPTNIKLPQQQRNQFDYFGGEARLREEAEARALETKLNSDGEDNNPERNSNSNSPTSSSSQYYPASGKVPLRLSVNAEGLARCLAGHEEARKKLQVLEAACKSIKATPVSQHLLDLLSNSRKNKKKKQSSSKKKTTTVKEVAKKSWGKLKNVVQSGFGMSIAAAQTKAVEQAMANIDTNGDGKSVLLTLDSIAQINGSNNKMTKTKKTRLTRRVKTPRLKDGRVVPPWQPPPNQCLPFLKVRPRDVALLRVCKIPRKWAEQWLSGRDVESTSSGIFSPTSLPSSSSFITKVKKSAMSFEDARVVLPHSHTYLFQHTGRFVTTVLDRTRLLNMLRVHPLGPTPETLQETVSMLKAERPADGGPSGATFDRRLADNLSYRQAPRAIISHGLVGGHTHALEREVKYQFGPGPATVGPGPGFGSYLGTYKPSMRFNTSNHESKKSLTMLRKGSRNPSETENIGPGAQAYNTRPPDYQDGFFSTAATSSMHQVSGGMIGQGQRFVNHQFVTPAPHDYVIESGEKKLSTVSSIAERGGIMAGKDKSELDHLIRRSSSTPGPQRYRPRIQETINAPKFSTTFAPSDLDLTIARAAETPGPGLYFGSSGGVPSNPNVQEGGIAPKFASGNYPSDLDLTMARAAMTPGPSKYGLVALEKLSQYRANPAQRRMRHPPVETKEESGARRRAKLPGPSRYADAYQLSASDRLGGGKFSTAYPPSQLETTILNGSRTPGPVDYQPTKYNRKDPFLPGPTGSGLHKMRGTPGTIISKSKIPSVTEQAMIDGSRSPFWVHKQGDDKKIKRRVGGAVGRISSADTLSDVDLIVLRASQSPGPLDYNIGTGMADSIMKRGGGRFSTSFVPSDLEVQIERAKNRPGPSDFTVRDVRKRIPTTRFSTSTSIRGVERLMREASLLPGPVDYQPISYNLPRS